MPHPFPTEYEETEVAFGPLSIAITGGARHAPPVQASFARQTREHAPQLVVLVRRSTSHPLTPTLSQSPNPTLQAATVHEPEEQAAVALGTEQTRPHSPQAVALVFKLVSQPLLNALSQSPKPETQPQVRLPAVFVQVEFAPQPPFADRHSSMSAQASPSPA